jgi:hypothetical protein
MDGGLKPQTSNFKLLRLWHYFRILFLNRIMENMNHHMPVRDNRTGEYQEANDRISHMTDLDKCLNKLEADGYTDQFRVEKGKLNDLTNCKKYKPKDVRAVNFYRFEGVSDPDDMSILYAIETTDGRKGTLVDAYGLYSDDETGEFLNQVETNKKVNGIGNA